MPEKSPLQQLADHGQSVWIDFLSRQLLQSGELARMMREDAVVGVTSNPTIFQKAISQGDAYDDQLRECLERLDDPKEIYLHLTHDDVAEAKRLHGLIEKPNLYVKIPATKPGLGAIEDMIALGKNINVTLIFSLERHKEVMEAYIRGLERLVESGGDPSRVASVASYFVSRVDTETDKRLDALGGHDDLKGKLGVANSKLAYQNWKQVFAGPRWEALAAKGATTQRCLWASTSVKNPAYRDVMYVEELIGPETVNTMPEETIRAFQDHGEVRGDTVLEGVDEAQRLFEQLAEAGVDYDDVSETLEKEGVEKFADSFEELKSGIMGKLGALQTA